MINNVLTSGINAILVGYHKESPIDTINRVAYYFISRLVGVGNLDSKGKVLWNKIHGVLEVYTQLPFMIGDS